MKRAVVGAALLVSGCVRDRSILDPAGPAAQRLYDLGWPIVVGFTVVSAAMWLLIGWSGYRRTGTFGEHEPAGTGGGLGWVMIGGVAIPMIAFATVFVGTLETMAAFPMEHAGDGHADIRVTGHQWWWEVEYLGDGPQDLVRSANELHVLAGRPVDIELRSVDVIHSFWVPRLHGKVDLVPGQVNRIRLQADRPGVYQGVCAELCGAQHAHMRFLLVAEDAGAHARWLARERSAAAEPTSAEGQRGRMLFETRACVACHAIRGTRALARFGPDLTHLASRRMLGAGSFPNDLATLSAWVTNAPSLKPGVQMPALNEFTGNELQDLTAYLNGLE